MVPGLNEGNIELCTDIEFKEEKKILKNPNTYVEY